MSKTNRGAAKKTTLTDDQMARRVRSTLVDKTGDDTWAAVALSAVLGAVPYDVSAEDFDAERAADGVLDQGFEPNHLLG